MYLFYHLREKTVKSNGLRLHEILWKDYFSCQITKSFLYYNYTSTSQFCVKICQMTGSILCTLRFHEIWPLLQTSISYFNENSYFYCQIIKRSFKFSHLTSFLFFYRLLWTIMFFGQMARKWRNGYWYCFGLGCQSHMSSSCYQILWKTPDFQRK